MSKIDLSYAFGNRPYDVIVRNKNDLHTYLQYHVRSEKAAIIAAKECAKSYDYSAVVYRPTNETIWESGEIEQSKTMIEISGPIEEFQSCNACGRYNKRGPGPEQMYKSLCKNIRRYTLYNGLCIRLCEDCARELRNQLNELLEVDDEDRNKRN